MLVSIGLPTFNRADLLDRAIRSVLNQDHAEFELIVSDNASTDETETLCQEWARRDPRVRYVRQAANIGPTANFESVLAAARGEYFLWLSDDDWIDANYLSACLHAIAAHPDVAIAAGRCLHYDATGRFIRDDVPTNLRQPDAGDRLRAYFAQVSYNSIFYGVMRTAVLRGVGMPNALATDWIVLAWMLLHGYAVTVDTTRVHRTLGGTSKSVRNVIRVFRLPRYQALAPELTVALNCRRALLRMAWPDGKDYEARRRIADDIRTMLIVRRTKIRRYIPKFVRTAIVNRLTHPRGASPG